MGGKRLLCLRNGAKKADIEIVGGRGRARDKKEVAENGKRGRYTYTTYTILPMTITVPASLHHVRLHSISATVANVTPRARTQARPGGQKQGSLSIGGMVFGGGFPASS